LTERWDPDFQPRAWPWKVPRPADGSPWAEIVVEHDHHDSQQIARVAPSGLPWNCMLHFLAIEACSTATICPVIWANSAAVCSRGAMKR
jgi:hypothetical protein